MPKETHTCAEMKYRISDTGDSITIENTGGNWYLTRICYADEEAVADGEAEYAGEILSEFAMCITYCPFCGMNLAAESLTESEYAGTPALAS
jgi:hypothetical protein